MITLAVVVMAHPSRATQAHELASKVDADEIVFDTDNDEIHTGQKSWLQAWSLGKTHSIVIQDDARPIDRFRKYALEAIAAKPSNPISFYLGQSRPRRWVENMTKAVAEAERRQVSWLESSNMLHGVCIGLRSLWIGPMLEQWSRLAPLPYDQRIGAYFRRVQERPIVYTWPSLVDHDDSLSSLASVGTDVSPTDGRVAFKIGVPTFDRPDTIVIARPASAPW